MCFEHNFLLIISETSFFPFLSLVASFSSLSKKKSASRILIDFLNNRWHTHRKIKWGRISNDLSSFTLHSEHLEMGRYGHVDKGSLTLMRLYGKAAPASSYAPRVMSGRILYLYINNYNYIYLYK